MMLHERKRKRVAYQRQLSRGFEQFEARTLLHAGVLDAPEAEGVGDTISDFQLLDVNPTSATYNQLVSPSDFSQQTTLWYFGHST